MSGNGSQRKVYKRRSGLFWPILLIGLGIVILLNNIGALDSDIGSSLLRLWPLLFVMMGLDGLWKREGFVSSVLVIALGTVFLMSNFGYLSLSVWGVIIRIWPLFFIAWGFDLFVGRRTLLGAVAGSVLIIAILAGALWSMGAKAPEGQILQTNQIRQELGGASRARVDIQPAAGSVSLKRLAEPVALLTGTVPSDGQWKVQQDFSITGDQAVFILSNGGGPFVMRSDMSAAEWILELTDAVPVALNIDLGVGEVDLDLTGLVLSAFSVDMGVGQVTVLLPAKGNFDASIDSAIGQIVIVVPEGLGIRIEAGTALVALDVPGDYRKDGSTYTSPNYANAEYRINLNVGLAIGQVVIRKK